MIERRACDWHFFAKEDKVRWILAARIYLLPRNYLGILFEESLQGVLRSLTKQSLTHLSGSHRFQAILQLYKGLTGMLRDLVNVSITPI